ncbi:MAG TPA: class I SAM-dependent methyltransferase [Aggregatilinea sp.]|uniref:class I SAM-dependent methyltransferase n=1 Tax=Aggregatilinea sp. TaxID=2806333 RepID=UPI002C058DCC|nr:class I SAM-dependent methyltransferase [Aggregatilinea sp.]HML23455.1 class I SAM-dependent methyltransferase [Aggregatilinea sp.]
MSASEAESGGAPGVQTDYSDSELSYNRFMEPALRNALASLDLPPDSRGVDLGCGPGGLFALLDDMTGHSAQITGLDISAGHLETARREIARQDLGARFDVMQANLRDALPFPDDTFDWAWTADTLNSATDEGPFPDPVEVLREARRVVRPGGIVACFLTNRLGAIYLPGYAAIEHHLATAVSVRYNKKDRVHPSFRNENPLAWFQAAGLRDVILSPHVVLYEQPLPPRVRAYIHRYIFEAEYGPAEDLKPYALGVGLTEDDWQTWLDISDPGSPQYLLAQPAYYCLRYAVMAVGRV